MLLRHIDFFDHNTSQYCFCAERVGKQKIAYNFLVDAPVYFRCLSPSPSLKSQRNQSVSETKSGRTDASKYPQVLHSGPYAVLSAFFQKLKRFASLHKRFAARQGHSPVASVKSAVFDPFGDNLIACHFRK